MHVVRTHNGADDASYACVHQAEDGDGRVGVRLSKDLLAVAGATLKANITTLGPLVLPVPEQARQGRGGGGGARQKERGRPLPATALANPLWPPRQPPRPPPPTHPSTQLLFLANLAARRLLGWKVPPYVPDFKLAFDHFCLHTGGRAVIDALEAQLRLTPELVRPSKEAREADGRTGGGREGRAPEAAPLTTSHPTHSSKALHRYGNTSSASIWYVLAWIEGHGAGVARGDRVWQIAFGSGFKVNSAVWRAVRGVKQVHRAYDD